MNHKRTMHIEFQAENYLSALNIENRLTDAIKMVVWFAAYENGLEGDAYMGDRTMTKGWESDPSEDDVGVTRSAEQERINGLIDDLEVKYSEPFKRCGKGLPWRGNTVCPADRMEFGVEFDMGGGG